MTALRDFVPQLTNETDFQIQRKRGETWERKEREDFNLRKRQALGMFREHETHGSTRNDVFRVARIAKLPILVVREIEAEYNKRSQTITGRN